MPNPFQVLRRGQALAQALACAAICLASCSAEQAAGPPAAAHAGDARARHTPGPEPPAVSVRGETVEVEIACTEDSRRLGLGGRDSLPGGCGMLFIYPERRMMFFWMKGMRFPIDIIWIDGDEIVDFHESVQPEPGQKSESGLRKYFPRKPADKVLETGAGFCRRAGISMGDRVSFNPPAAALGGR